MNLNEVFSIIPKDSHRYLDYYFYEMVNLKKEKSIYSKIIDNCQYSIMKDDPKRVLEGSGKLRARPWSNFLFYFINRKDYVKLFGTNAKKRKIFNDRIENGVFSLTDWDCSYQGKDPNNLFLNKENNRKLAKGLLDIIKNQKPFIFIRSYVYLTIIIWDDTENITIDIFLPYYFNTTYNFTETNGKRDFIPSLKYSYLVEDIDFELELIQDNNRDTIDCARAFIGQFDYFDQTKYHLDNIIRDIDRGDKYILIEGAARTGKTIIAMSLLNKYTKANLLVMNHYFYNALQDAFELLNYPFPKNRIFHQSYGVDGFYDGRLKMNFQFAIIDECQRLGQRYGLVERIISNKFNLHTVLLGDNNQRLNPSSDDGLEFVIEEIIKTNKSVKHYKFNNSIGIPPEVVRNIKYLLGFSEIHNPSNLGEYIINIFDSKDTFLNDYEKNPLQKKHLCTIQVPVQDFSDIGKYVAYPLQLKNSHFPYFLDKDVINKYYFSPYQMISRELDAMYVYIRKNINVKDIEDYVLTNLYVLMTRAAISLNIYIEDKETHEYFTTRLEMIKSYVSESTINIESLPSNTQFVVDEDKLDDFCNSYNLISPKEDIEKRFISRLVHFTNEKNIDNIKKFGLLPKNELIRLNILSEFNDVNRLDGHEDGICLSVENPNDYLLKVYQNRYRNVKYKLVTINPSILYAILKKNGDRIELVKRIYCNYNAASNLTLKSFEDLNIMYRSEVQTYHGIFTRNNKPESVPTAVQAEIIFLGSIPPEFIESIEDI